VASADSERGKRHLPNSNKAPDETRIKISITRASFTLSIYKGTLKMTEKQITLGSARIIGLTAFSLGTAALAASVISTFSTLAFVGLALVVLSSAAMIYIPVADYMKGHNLQTHGAKMLQKKNINAHARANILFILTMLTLGSFSLALSLVNGSTVLALIGLGLIFWGALLWYVVPTKHVTLRLLTATASSPLASVEILLANMKPQGKGIYLPPKYLKDLESSIVFVPSKAHGTFPIPEQVDEEAVDSKGWKGIFLVPTGFSLSKLFEERLEMPFTATSLADLQAKLPNLLVEELEIAEDAEIETQLDTVTVRLSEHIFSQLCEETRTLKTTHEYIGCPISSAIACALAKATGKPITIEKEEQTQNGKTTEIQYRILEE
jgi:hypothetical protein